MGNGKGQQDMAGRATTAEHPEAFRSLAARLAGSEAG
jgi:hypothetical protein